MKFKNMNVMHVMLKEFIHLKSKHLRPLERLCLHIYHMLVGSLSDVVHLQVSGHEGLHAIVADVAPRVHLLDTVADAAPRTHLHAIVADAAPRTHLLDTVHVEEVAL